MIAKSRTEDLVVQIISRKGECSGRYLRDRLNHGLWWWRKWSGPAFYQMMANLEDSGRVEGRYLEKEIEGQIVKERRYTLKDPQ